MRLLFFVTDRYPYDNSETFIENEINIISEAFDRIYIIPSGLTANTSISRNVPDNVIVFPPANTDDLYAKGHVTKLQRITWSLKHMVPWIIRSFFTKTFIMEISSLAEKKELSIRKIISIVRTIAPDIRNVEHFTSYSNLIEVDPCDEVYVYSYWLTSAVMLPEALINNKNVNIKRIVARAHGYDLYEHRRNHNYIPLKKQIIEYVDNVSLISNAGKDYLSNQFPQCRSKFDVNYLGTKDYGIQKNASRNAFRIVSCASVIPLKRITRIVDALKIISDLNIEWVHFGAGDGLEKLKSYAEMKLSNMPNINYEFKGHIDNRGLMNIYKNDSFDVFINVSESEGLPVSIMEAISFGIPTIATDVGGTSEAVKENLTGVLLKKDFSDAELCQAIRYFASLTSDERENIRQKTRHYWQEHFSANNNYKVFIEQYFYK